MEGSRAGDDGICRMLEMVSAVVRMNQPSAAVLRRLDLLYTSTCSRLGEIQLSSPSPLRACDITNWLMNPDIGFFGRIKACASASA